MGEALIAHRRNCYQSCRKMAALTGSMQKGKTDEEKSEKTWNGRTSNTRFAKTRIVRELAAVSR
jgi:hypothetical protein